jgi:uncharacterized protein
MPAMATIARLCRYPVKGLSAEDLPQVEVLAGEGLPLDRAFALARPAAPFDPASPKWLPKRHFLMLMRDERLASLRVAYDDAEGRLTISQGGRVALAASVRTPDGRDAIERFFEGFMGPELGGRPRLVRASGHMFTDHATPCLSVINLASVQELERALGRPVDPLRFRANLYLEGLPAWAELDWPGRTLRAGAVLCRVAERIERCAATNVDPASAERDLNIPLALRRNWGHIDCGVLLQVTRGGALGAGDSIELV